eukprot:TRINITY_DN5040_c0_g1_i1.p1 TRINITY_DN5040_c0_g1~~TRINITY_DN5040_c0_g1_i1.p1  ORF type:complete len:744 (-),score=128.33 TRINITY_DN5040_c0_g1_i1:19-2229(-)
MVRVVIERLEEGYEGLEEARADDRSPSRQEDMPRVPVRLGLSACLVVGIVWLGTKSADHQGRAHLDSSASSVVSLAIKVSDSHLQDCHKKCKKKGRSFKFEKKGGHLVCECTSDPYVEQINVGDLTQLGRQSCEDHCKASHYGFQWANSSGKNECQCTTVAAPSQKNVSTKTKTTATSVLTKMANCKATCKKSGKGYTWSMDSGCTCSGKYVETEKVGPVQNLSKAKCQQTCEKEHYGWQWKQSATGENECQCMVTVSNLSSVNNTRTHSNTSAVTSVLTKMANCKAKCKKTDKGYTWSMDSGCTCSGKYVETKKVGPVQNLNKAKCQQTCEKEHYGWQWKQSSTGQNECQCMTTVSNSSNVNTTGHASQVLSSMVPLPAVLPTLQLPQVASQVSNATKVGPMTHTKRKNVISQLKDYYAHTFGNKSQPVQSMLSPGLPASQSSQSSDRRRRSDSLALGLGLGLGLGIPAVVGTGLGVGLGTQAAPTAGATLGAAPMGELLGGGAPPLNLQAYGTYCYDVCGSRSGYCLKCGEGNACCKAGGDEANFTECQNLTAYRTDNYECVEPVAPKSAQRAGAEAAAFAKSQGLDLQQQITAASVLASNTTLGAVEQMRAAGTAAANAAASAGLSYTDSFAAAKAAAIQTGVYAGMTDAEASSTANANSYYLAPTKGALTNAGDDCWEACGHKSGYCNYCGVGHACCREHFTEDDAPECKSGVTGFSTWHHECVATEHVFRK